MRLCPFITSVLSHWLSSFLVQKFFSEFHFCNFPLSILPFIRSSPSLFTFRSCIWSKNRHVVARLRTRFVVHCFIIPYVLHATARHTLFFTHPTIYLKYPLFFALDPSSLSSKHTLPPTWPSSSYPPSLLSSLPLFLPLALLSPLICYLFHFSPLKQFPVLHLLTSLRTCPLLS